MVLASGSGTNLQRIIDACDSGEIPHARVSLVVTDRDCYAQERARLHCIPHRFIPRGKDFSQQLNADLPADTALIVLAGFLSILNQEFCDEWNGKIVNIHPALLPKFGGKGMWGMNVHRAVKEAAETQSGATVHFVTPGIDEGETILQECFEVSLDDTAEDIAGKVHEVEQRIFPKAIVKALDKMEAAEKIAFVTDLHFSEKNILDKGATPLDNWKHILSDLKQRGVRKLVIGGDIGNPVSHSDFFNDIKDFDWQLILGNHDRLDSLRSYLPFECTGETLYYTQQFGDYNFIFLDTSSEKLSREQQRFLEEKLSSSLKPIVFIHHPVMTVDTWMDKNHPLKNREQVRTILTDYSRDVTLICGHYHLHFEGQYNNVRQVIAPAAAYQVKFNPDENVPDVNEFGYLLLDFSRPELTVEAVKFQR